MSQLSLHQQVIKQTQTTEQFVSALKSEDPLKDWFKLELQQLGVWDGETQLPLEETNARLGGLRQLHYLVRDHLVRLQNPDYEAPAKQFPDSFLTVQARQPANVSDSARQFGFTIAPELLHDPASDNQQFDPVSPTAKIVGYLRGLDRSLRISEGLSPTSEGQGLLSELGITNPKTQALMSVLFQSRYHALNAAMVGQDHESKQIVEFASGISPRGHQWAQMSPGTIYVESDLPHLMLHKAKLVRNQYLADQKKARGVHHCCAADVLDQESVFSTVENLDTRHPFTIVTEGLLLYFELDEMHTFLANIAAVLHQFPKATWVTDFVTKSDLSTLFESDEDVARSVRAVFRQTGRKVVSENPFEHEDCVGKMLEEFGLRVEGKVPLRRVTSDLRFDFEVEQECRDRVVGSRKAWRIVGGEISPLTA